MLWQQKKNTSLGSRKKPTLSQKLLQIVLDNPFTALWNIVLFIGGTILLLYHAGIGYLPDFSIADLTGLLASVTLTGIGIIIFIAAAFLLPSYALSWIEFEIFSKGNERVFSKSNEKFLLLLLPCVCWGIVFLSPYLPYFKLLSERNRTILVFFSVLIVSSTASTLYLAYQSKPNNESFSTHISTNKKNIAIRIATLIFWSFLFLIPMQLSVIFASSGEPALELIILLGVFFLSLIINGTAYVLGNQNRWGPIGIAALIIGVVIPFLNGRPLLWPELIVQSLGLGNRHASEIVVSYKQCQSLSKFGLQCNYKENKDAEISISNVNILSRVGTSVYVELLISSTSDLQAAPRNKELTSGKWHTYCRDKSDSNGIKTCSQCDSLLLKKANPGSAVPNADETERSLNQYKSNLICVQIGIPKEHVTSMSLSTGRKYNGFTTASAAIE